MTDTAGRLQDLRGTLFYDHNYESPTYYKFNSFIISPYLNMILPTNTFGEVFIKKVYGAISAPNSLIYISSKQEDFLVKIKKDNGISLLENDAYLISETDENSLYKVSSNIGFTVPIDDNISLEISNNLKDINGALKNINMDSTNTIIFKIDPSEYAKDWNNITFEMNVNLEEIKDLIFKENKFIKFINPNDNYYIS
jgi:hypothetical protein